jgi:hypothetical protein
VRITDEPTDPIALVALTSGLAPFAVVLLALGGAVFGIFTALGIIASVVLVVAVPCALAFGLAGVVRAHRRGSSFALAGLGLGLGVAWLVVLGGVAWYISRFT